MKPTQQWLKQMQKEASKLSKNVNTENIKSHLNSASKQMNDALHHHYQQLPKYKAQCQSQLSKLSNHGKHLQSEFQQKFHDFSSSNPTFKRYHSKYRDQMHNLTKHVPKLKVNEMKKSIESTVDSTKQIASSVQSTAKQV